MEELIEAIYKMTNDMKRCLEEEKFEAFELLLTDRHKLMSSVDELKNKEKNFEYSPNMKQRMKDIQAIDQLITPLVEKSLTETKILINHIKKQKQVSEQYHPYFKQINGVFLDSKR
ncbi:flagellar protein FliT [Bacillus sp. MM2020_1]|nr:flagellar protein FliT [Bacillus sp. MM2020_1]